MIVRTSIVLVVTGTLFTLIGLFAPAANLGAAATPASFYQIVGGLLDWKVGAPELPAGLKAIEMRLLGGAAILLVSAFLAIGMAIFKFLRGSLIPCVIMTLAAGFLMFTMAGIRDVAVAVPQSYGWILLIAGSLVASVTAVFNLFGPGPEEAARRKTMSEAPKKRGRLPFEVEAPTQSEVQPEPVAPPQPSPPKSAPPKPAAPKAAPPLKPAPSPKPSPSPKPAPKPVSPKADPAEPKHLASKAGDAKPAHPKAPDGPTPKAGHREVSPDTLAPMPTSGYSGEEPTESGGWVLSGFDANGMAVRLNISDIDLRTADDGILIGRNAKQCRLVLNDDSVSRRHARLSGGNPLTIEDLDSANGTVVNREALAPGQKIPIEPGVAIEIGSVRLTLVRS